MDKVLYVDGISAKKDYSPPRPVDILNLSKKEMEKILETELKESKIVEERGSAFYGYAMKVSEKKQIEDAYRKMWLWHPEADHITMACAFEARTQSCDDGEHNLGLKLQKMMDEWQEQNVVVFVVREYGGVRIGVKRFHIALNVAKEALNKL